MIRKWLEPKLVDHRFRAPRLWSNGVLRKIAPLLTGDVINVSAWKDGDKDGGVYRDYFTNASSYSISNYGGYRGESEQDNYEIDLEGTLPEELHGKFDVVYNHTTLEHVFDVFAAVRNLCDLSNDIVVVVVPAVQEEHASDSFSDYWRFATNSMIELFRRNGFESVFMTSNHNAGTSVYHVCIATRNPSKWAGKFDHLAAKVNTGKNLFKHPIRRFLRRKFKLD